VDSIDDVIGRVAALDPSGPKCEGLPVVSLGFPILSQSLEAAPQPVNAVGLERVRPLLAFPAGVFLWRRRAFQQPAIHSDRILEAAECGGGGGEVPQCEGTIRDDLERSQDELQRLFILFLLIKGDRELREDPMVFRVFLALLLEQGARLNPLALEDELINPVSPISPGQASQSP
jgi:hypothetical protein